MLNKQILPGLFSCIVFAVMGYGLQEVLKYFYGSLVIEGLVFSLLLGLVWRNFFSKSVALLPGARFASKELLEFAIVLLGATLDFRTILNAGPLVLLCVFVLITITILLAVIVGRMLGLNSKVALLVGVGNGICGNSAIAAVAPIIRATNDDIASAVGFTAVSGVVFVLLLPLLPQVSSLTDGQYGFIAGMTVYAVPQVLAATYSVSAQSVTVATLIKLIRVLFLSPLVFFFSLTHSSSTPGKFQISRYLPWFMVGFFIMAALRSSGVITPEVGDGIKGIGKVLSMLAMGGIGLAVDLRTIAQSSRAVIATVLISLAFLLINSWWLSFVLAW